LNLIKNRVKPIYRDDLGYFEGFRLTKKWTTEHIKQFLEKYDLIRHCPIKVNIFKSLQIFELNDETVRQQGKSRKKSAGVRHDKIKDRILFSPKFMG
jgi:hypothetical protein